MCDNDLDNEEMRRCKYSILEGYRNINKQNLDQLKRQLIVKHQLKLPVNGYMSEAKRNEKK